jgi:hypothetical protein
MDADRSVAFCSLYSRAFSPGAKGSPTNRRLHAELLRQKIHDDWQREANRGPEPYYEEGGWRSRKLKRTAYMEQLLRVVRGQHGE